MVHYLTSVKLDESKKTIGDLEKGLCSQEIELIKIQNDLDSLEKTRQSLSAQLDAINLKMVKLISKKDKVFALKIQPLTLKIKELKNVVENTNVISIIEVNDEKYNHKNGLVDLGRYALMKLTKIIQNASDIRNIIGITGLFHTWASRKIFVLKHAFDDRNFLIIKQWLGESVKFIPLYKALVNGFAAAAFHKKCDNKGATVTIITTTKGYVFGAYAAVSWDSSSGFKIDKNRQSFLFSLKNPLLSSPAKFKLLNEFYGIFCGKHCGPAFGCCQGGNLLCSDNSNQNKDSHAKVGCCYENTTDLNRAAVFAGEYQFITSDIEVYHVQEQ